ncbi:MAG: helix-hairpin-helix domain-containing protein, partial [Synergistaceae bacterium]|nr:helix-hairpin-helix domain-containing protein [Synergistaceae bacterium]
MDNSTQGDAGQQRPKELTGQIERITYSDAESGYSVLRLRVRGYPELVTAVGCIAPPSVGEELKMTGEWQQHPKFGEQFRIETCESAAPSTIAGLEKYLGSGLIKGVGPSMAQRIVSKFGEDTFKILDDAPDRLLEIEGIGEKKIAVIKESWVEQRGIRDVMLFLQSYGIGAGYAVRVFRQYGADSLAVLQENPYRLAIDIFGIGFLTADKIAASMGFSKDSPLRIRAGVLHVMTQLVGEGHVFVPVEELSRMSAEILDVPQGLAEEGIEAARLAEELILE